MPSRCSRSSPSWQRGLGSAALGEMTFKGGRAEQDNFHTYEVMRMSGAPRETRVHIIPGDYGQPMGGVGEPGVPPIAPAPSTG
jgi:isoquinoline 1-oxidoreductase beta subunit